MGRKKIMVTWGKIWGCLSKQKTSKTLGVRSKERKLLRAKGRKEKIPGNSFPKQKVKAWELIIGELIFKMRKYCKGNYLLEVAKLCTGELKGV